MSRRTIPWSYDHRLQSSDIRRVFKMSRITRLTGIIGVSRCDDEMPAILNRADLGQFFLPILDRSTFNYRTKKAIFIMHGLVPFFLLARFILVAFPRGAAHALPSARSHVLPRPRLLSQLPLRPAWPHARTHSSREVLMHYA